MESDLIKENGGQETESSVKKANVWVVIITSLLLLLLILSLPVFIAPAVQDMKLRYSGKMALDSALLSEPVVKKNLGKITKEIGMLDRNLDKFLPHTPYIIINTTKNRFMLYDNKGDLVREGFCSSGSYTKLVSEKKTWIFKTPRGRLTVLSKIEHPVWTKPDWAFIEEGVPIPSYGDPARYEKGVLGDYALRMADGYLLHGTLYKRFLGMPVTHGCVRFGDDDLEVVYHTLAVGSYVYIY